ncbi:serine acetyltransferase [Porifericola rhodea]|uniref:serine O-acetyltransferase n=1 Tax=Porifericola rhodea TaxID=930972 RepID=UPI002665E57D|nr:serine acetyltransferase [Porifericola rhodea]WKN29724.1 serine acetyltransferase [Porifericola rhodea]
MDSSFINKLYHSHQECIKCPSSKAIITFFEELMGILFPPFAHENVGSLGDFQERIRSAKLDMGKILYSNLVNNNHNADEIANAFFQAVPELYEKLLKDIEAMFAGDPAAQSRDEIIRTYPGFYAIAAYRIANKLSALGVKSIPRLITEHAHSKTSIDIHPHATIGEHFCIDHGTGVVIGETTVIGDYVKLYQGVTLGALSVSKEDAKTKRHPSIEDHVVVYSGATILGGNTVIGHHSVVGGNVWLTRSIAPYSKVYYQARMHNSEQGDTDLIIFKEHTTSS